MAQAVRWGQLAQGVQKCRRDCPSSAGTDLSYREIASEMGISMPSEDYKLEPSAAFIDRKLFDPSNPVGYINGLRIVPRLPQSFFLFYY
jgi:nitrate/nitrite transport system substrate-binding protein